MEMIRSGMKQCGDRVRKMDLDVYKITDRLQDRDCPYFTVSCPIDPNADSTIQVRVLTQCPSICDDIISK